MDRQIASCKKNIWGVKNQTENPSSFTKDQLGKTDTTKKISLSMPNYNYNQFYEKFKLDLTPLEACHKKRDQNLVTSAFQSVTSYNNSKQQPTMNEYKIVKSKQGESFNRDQNQSKVLDSFLKIKAQKPSRVCVSKSKQDGVQVYKKTTTSTSTSQSGDDRKHVSYASKTSNQSQASQSVTSYNNSKQQPTKNEYKIVKTKQDQTQVGLSNEDQNQLKTLDLFLNIKTRQPSYNNFCMSKSKQDGGQAYKKTAPNLMKTSTCTSQSRDDLKHVSYESKSSNHSQAVTGEKLKQTGTPFAFRELIEAVPKLEKQNHKQDFEKDVALTSTETELNIIGNFVDRKTLEEIEMWKQEKTCKICLEAQVGIVFVPCGHLVACVKCSENLKTCPMCRVKIQSKLKTFFS